MEGSKRIKQLYGYTTCFVVLITFLVGLGGLIGASFSLTDPLRVDDYPCAKVNLASFEIYKMDILRSAQQGEQPSTPGYVPDDETLHRMYEAARDDKIQTVLFVLRRGMLENGVLVIVCIVLFATHWVWMRKLAKAEA